MYLWLKGGILYRTQNILPTQNILLIQNILLTQNIVLTQSIPLTQNILLTQNMTLIQNILLNQKPNMICAEEHIEKIIFKEEERNDSFGRKRRINWKESIGMVETGGTFSLTQTKGFPRKKFLFFL